MFVDYPGQRAFLSLAFLTWSPPPHWMPDEACYYPPPPPVPADQSTSLSKPLTGSKQAEITLVAIPLSLPVASNVHLLDLEITNTNSPHQYSLLSACVGRWTRGWCWWCSWPSPWSSRWPVSSPWSSTRRVLSSSKIIRSVRIMKEMIRQR